MIKIERQRLVGLHIGAKDLGDHFLIGRTVEKLAVVAILDTQHFGAVGVIAAAFAPEISQLQCRHQKLKRPCPIHFLTHDLLNVLQHLKTER